MKIYLLCENIDLGYAVIEVLDKLPEGAVPTVGFSYLGTSQETRVPIADSWDMVGSDRFVLAFPLKVST